MEIESEPVAGTAVRLLLPRDGEAKAGPDAVAEGAEGKRLLLVDDDAPLRRVMVRVLQLHGYIVSEAGNGKEALQMIHEGLDPDIVISDLVMPDMGGEELARTLRTEGSTARILLTSGYEWAEGSGALEGLAGISFLGKPWDIEDLVTAIAALEQPPVVLVGHTPP